MSISLISLPKHPNSSTLSSKSIESKGSITKKAPTKPPFKKATGTALVINSKGPIDTKGIQNPWKLPKIVKGGPLKKPPLASKPVTKGQYSALEGLRGPVLPAVSQGGSSSQSKEVSGKTGFTKGSSLTGAVDDSSSEASELRGDPNSSSSEIGIPSRSSVSLFREAFFPLPKEPLSKRLTESSPLPEGATSGSPQSASSAVRGAFKGSEVKVVKSAGSFSSSALSKKSSEGLPIGVSGSSEAVGGCSSPLSRISFEGHPKSTSTRPFSGVGKAIGSSSTLLPKKLSGESRSSDSGAGKGNGSSASSLSRKSSIGTFKSSDFEVGQSIGSSDLLSGKFPAGESIGSSRSSDAGMSQNIGRSSSSLSEKSLAGESIGSSGDAEASKAVGTSALSSRESSGAEPKRSLRRTDTEVSRATGNLTPLPRKSPEGDSGRSSESSDVEPNKATLRSISSLERHSSGGDSVGLSRSSDVGVSNSIGSSSSLSSRGSPEGGSTGPSRRSGVVSKLIGSFAASSSKTSEGFSTGVSRPEKGISNGQEESFPESLEKVPGSFLTVPDGLPRSSTAKWKTAPGTSPGSSKDLPKSTPSPIKGSSVDSPSLSKGVEPQISSLVCGSAERWAKTSRESPAIPPAVSIGKLPSPTKSLPRAPTPLSKGIPQKPPSAVKEKEASRSAQSKETVETNTFKSAGRAVSTAGSNKLRGSEASLPKKDIEALRAELEDSVTASLSSPKGHRGSSPTPSEGTVDGFPTGAEQSAAKLLSASKISTKDSFAQSKVKPGHPTEGSKVGPGGIPGGLEQALRGSTAMSKELKSIPPALRKRNIAAPLKSQGLQKSSASQSKGAPGGARSASRSTLQGPLADSNESSGTSFLDMKEEAGEAPTVSKRSGRGLASESGKFGPNYSALSSKSAGGTLRPSKGAPSSKLSKGPPGTASAVWKGKTLFPPVKASGSSPKTFKGPPGDKQPSEGSPDVPKKSIGGPFKKSKISQASSSALSNTFGGRTFAVSKATEVSQASQSDRSSGESERLSEASVPSRKYSGSLSPTSEKNVVGLLSDAKEFEGSQPAEPRGPSGDLPQESSKASQAESRTPSSRSRASSNRSSPSPKVSTSGSSSVSSGSSQPKLARPAPHTEAASGELLAHIASLNPPETKSPSESGLTLSSERNSHLSEMRGSGQVSSDSELEGRMGEHSASKRGETLGESFDDHYSQASSDSEQALASLPPGKSRAPPKRVQSLSRIQLSKSTPKLPVSSRARQPFGVRSTQGATTASFPDDRRSEKLGLSKGYLEESYSRQLGEQEHTELQVPAKVGKASPTEPHSSFSVPQPSVSCPRKCLQQPQQYSGNVSSMHFNPNLLSNESIEKRQESPANDKDNGKESAVTSSGMAAPFGCAWRECEYLHMGPTPCGLPEGGCCALKGLWAHQSAPTLSTPTAQFACPFGQSTGSMPQQFPISPPYWIYPLPPPPQPHGGHHPQSPTTFNLHLHMSPKSGQDEEGESNYASSESDLEVHDHRWGMTKRDRRWVRVPYEQRFNPPPPLVSPRYVPISATCSGISGPSYRTLYTRPRKYKMGNTYCKHYQLPTVASLLRAGMPEFLRKRPIKIMTEGSGRNVRVDGSLQFEMQLEKDGDKLVPASTTFVFGPNRDADTPDLPKEAQSASCHNPQAHGCHCCSHKGAPRLCLAMSSQTGPPAGYMIPMNAPHGHLTPGSPIHGHDPWQTALLGQFPGNPACFVVGPQPQAAVSHHQHFQMGPHMKPNLGPLVGPAMVPGMAQPPPTLANEPLERPLCPLYGWQTGPFETGARSSLPPPVQWTMAGHPVGPPAAHGAPPTPLHPSSCCAPSPYGNPMPHSPSHPSSAPGSPLHANQHPYFLPHGSQYDPFHPSSAPGSPLHANQHPHFLQHGSQCNPFHPSSAPGSPLHANQHPHFLQHGSPCNPGCGEGMQRGANHHHIPRQCAMHSAPPGVPQCAMHSAPSGVFPAPHPPGMLGSNPVPGQWAQPRPSRNCQFSNQPQMQGTAEGSHQGPGNWQGASPAPIESPVPACGGCQAEQPQQGMVVTDVHTLEGEGNIVDDCGMRGAFKDAYRGSAAEDIFVCCRCPNNLQVLALLY